MNNVARYGRFVIALGLGAAMLAFAATAIAADTLPRLPAERVFHAAEASPGSVTFDHRSHVDAKNPQCTGCHPALFRILKSGPVAASARITHESMEAGRQCGACHNAKVAFGLDQCGLCHREDAAGKGR